ncbi:MAG TPA: RHS repeat-associated core domain-containing protein, partial [Ktedonobacterales bacterium]|nr:RHS repeat-associated core domain-containing protein [Ktedonobacterales bacterium]
GGLTQPYRFASGYLDASTGYLKFGERYDDTTQGRWTQQDPVGGSLGNPSSVCRYLYAKDDPVNLVDPSGRLSITTILSDFFTGCAQGGTVTATFAIGIGLFYRKWARKPPVCSWGMNGPSDLQTLLFGGIDTLCYL